MKKLSSKLVVITLLFIAFSCDNGFQLLPLHEQISGIWRFDEVTFRENWKLKQNDRTFVYEPFELQFLPNRIVVLYFFDEFGVFTSVEGLWDYDYTTSGCSGNCSEDTIINFYFEVPVPPFFVHEWEIRRLRPNTLRARERRSGGIFNYRLKRVD